MARYLLAYLCLLAVTLSTPSRADTVSCIVFKNYHAPYGTYAAHSTSSNKECCELCADDANCVAWTRDEHGRCALKNDAIQYLVKVSGVDSGIKYSGSGPPTLTHNDRVKATSLVVKADTPAPVQRQTRGGSVARASVSVSTSGGRAGGSVQADNSGVRSASFVDGSGRVETSGSNPSVSLATSLSLEDGKKEGRVLVTFYKAPVIVGQVVTVRGKSIPIVSTEDDEIHCYSCAQYPCPYFKGVSYKSENAPTDVSYEMCVFVANGKIIADFTSASHGDCCRACRANSKCVSWWRVASKKRCVLNSNLPASSSIESHAGNIYL